MKICKLKLKNLNSFRGEQEIDFESGLLSDASLVAITGPTGAGKTTLLDAGLRCLVWENAALERARQPKSEATSSVMEKKTDSLKSNLSQTIPVIWRLGPLRKKGLRRESCVMQTLTN